VCALEVVPPEGRRPVQRASGEEEGRGRAYRPQRRRRNAHVRLDVVVEGDRHREPPTRAALSRGLDDVARRYDAIRVDEMPQLALKDGFVDGCVERGRGADSVVDEDDPRGARPPLGEAPQDARVQRGSHRRARRP
jgi:hypothetical protein